LENAELDVGVYTFVATLFKHIAEEELDKSEALDLRTAWKESKECPVDAIEEEWPEDTAGISNVTDGDTDMAIKITIKTRTPKELVLVLLDPVQATTTRTMMTMMRMVHHSLTLIEGYRTI
jgi:hypothetical protein